MKSINPYFTFGGNCREAMTFYQQCLGGELSLQTIGESPMADKMPESMKSHILHAYLNLGNIAIMGSDMTPDDGLSRGNAVSTVLYCNSEEEIRATYEKLSADGGKALHPLENTFWNALFGDLVDKYGNYWVLNWERG